MLKKVDENILKGLSRDRKWWCRWNRALLGDEPLILFKTTHRFSFFKFKFYFLEVLHNGCPHVCTCIYIGSPLANSSEMTGNSQAISLQDVGGYWQPYDICVNKAVNCFFLYF